MGKKLLAAFIGGVAIFAMIFLAGRLQGGGGMTACLCGIGMIGGGVLATLIYSRMSTKPMRIGDGALLGALAGFIGGLPFAILAPLAVSMGGEELRTAFEDQLRERGASLSELPMSLTALAAMAGALVTLVTILMSLVGGLIGVALFEKRKPDTGAPPMPPPPPPPPDFGGPAGGGYGPGNYGSGG